MSAMLYDAPMLADTLPLPILDDVEMHNDWFDKMEDDQDHYSDAQSVEVDMDHHYENEYEMDDESYEDMSADVDPLDIDPEPLEDTTLFPAETDPIPEPAAVEAESHAFGVDSAAAHSELPDVSLPVPDAELPDAAAPLLPEAEPQPHEHVDPEEEDYTPVALTVEQAPDEPSELQANADSNDDDKTPQPEAESAGPPLVEAHVEPESRVEDVESEALFVPVDDSRPLSPAPYAQEFVDAPQELPVADDDAAGADPHEISDGVYIDPPPAILVAFGNPNVPDACLFNQPTPSRSPSPGHSAVDAPGFELLLEHNPILYYEPLAIVFDALRQEEYLARIPNLASVELILDAYDLQLSIAEDNIHAREVSLHDLNVLHDSSNISGPLRLRLNAESNRFIVRYRALQEHIARSSAADGDAQTADANDLQEQQEEIQPEEYEHQAFEAPEIDPVPPAPVVDEHVEPEDVPTDETSVVVPPPQEDESEAHEQVGAGADESHGENVEHYDLEPVEGDAADEEEGGEDEHSNEFVVVGQSDAPLAPAAPVVLGNGPEPASSTYADQPQAEAGPSKLPTTTANARDEPDTVANESADVVYEESYGEEDGEQWDDAEDGDEGNITWEAEVDHDTQSNRSSVTLASRASKRSIDEVEAEEDELAASPPGSPGPKRTRVD